MVDLWCNSSDERAKACRLLIVSYCTYNLGRTERDQGDDLNVAVL